MHYYDHWSYYSRCFLTDFLASISTAGHRVEASHLIHHHPLQLKSHTSAQTTTHTMSALNVSPHVFETTIDAYDTDYHWGGISIYPEGPVPTDVEYPGLPAGMTLPADLPIDLDYFVTPAPPHLAHIPFECPGAPRLDRKPVRPQVESTPLETHSNPRRGMSLYSSAHLLSCSRPTFVYAYECEGERWDDQPEHLRPIEANTHTLLPHEGSCEREAELVSLQVVQPQQVSNSDTRAWDRPRSNTHINNALRNFRAQFAEST
ncbi:unnamed protein product [Rhizoctonia solani]|uniref:Uncharacterized protein n=1 Tax=Rhizoctonia solani TaxID=456999 RepID=A0A8H3ALJ4_9AGAM|nr:unnamed protein product [Rhizoctonia solani]